MKTETAAKSSMMSGDSPNAFTNENVFEFKPTTSKEQAQSVSTASVLVEPKSEKEKFKDKEREREDEEPDQPDFSTPILNPGGEKDKEKKDEGRDSELNNGDDSRREGKKDETACLNGGLDRLPHPYGKNKQSEDEEDDSCIVNCIYYTMECCKCSIV